MKNKFCKSAVSILLIFVITLSIGAVSLVSASAANSKTEYTIDCTTERSSQETSSDIYIRVFGTKGSTGWHNIGEVGNGEHCSATFYDYNVGDVQKIEIEHFILGFFQNTWAPTTITVTTDQSSATFYNDKLTSYSEILTLSLTDNAYAIQIKTSGNVDKSGTDADVYLTLTDEDNETYKLELSYLHPKTNSFESGDESTLYFVAPDNIGKIKSVELSVENVWYDTAPKWHVSEFTLTQLYDNSLNGTHTFVVNDWITEDNPYTATLS